MSNLIDLKEKFFIAGSKGMVGSAIKRTLIENGYGNNKIGGEILGPSREELDLTDFTTLKRWFKKNNPSVVIIAAAKVGGIYANSNLPFDFILENLKIQNNLIELSWEFGVKRLLFLGSSCIYPKNCPQPILEEYLLSSQLESTNEYYAIAKIAGIKLCESLRKQHQFDSICLMPTNLYGPGDNYHPLNSHVIPALIRKFFNGKSEGSKFVECWGSGNPLREFLFVDDLASACVFALEKWAPNNNNGSSPCWINIGSDYELSIKDVAMKISKQIGYKGEIIWNSDMPDGTPRKKLNTTRINNLGWVAKTDLDKGLELTIKEYKKYYLKS
tara:strand:- start:794 stop:1780 length:987 start_codon:yes stop_codon:yes gene_type:complete